MGMEVNYVGNKSTNMFGPSAIFNAINLQQYTQEFEAGLNMSQSIPNPQGITGPTGQVINVTRQNSLRPLSTLGDITDPTVAGLRRALQRAADQLHQALLAGLPVQCELRLDEGHGRRVVRGPVLHQRRSRTGAPAGRSFYGDSHSLEKSISTYDIPSDFRLNYNWDIPVGKGKQFLNVQRGWINQIIGNWKTSGNLEERSGLPFSVWSGTAAGFPDDVRSHPSQRGSGRESDSAELEGQLR